MFRVKIPQVGSSSEGSGYVVFRDNVYDIDVVLIESPSILFCTYPFESAVETQPTLHVPQRYNLPEGVCVFFGVGFLAFCFLSFIIHGGQ